MTRVENNQTAKPEKSWVSVYVVCDENGYEISRTETPVDFGFSVVSVEVRKAQVRDE